MNTKKNGTSATENTCKLAHKVWWSYLFWVLAAAILGFVIPAVFAGLLRIPRNIYLIPYIVLIGALFFSYLRWSNINIGESIRYHWLWGVAGAIVAGVFASRTVLIQPSSPTPQGLELVFYILWLGLVYGTMDALFLSVLPISATWQAFSVLGWTNRWGGRIAAGVLALVASLLIIAVYHLGYPEFRGPQVGLIVVGVGIQSLLMLLTGSPIVVVLGHIAMHITAVLHGINSVSQLPPHY
jgi:hypothetical protein